MEGAYKDKYSFVGEWYDSRASLARRFLLFYFPSDHTLEMFDIKNRKTFVRRNKVQGVTLDNFYIGCSVNIFGRTIKIIDFACEDTRKKLQQSMEVTFCLIKPVEPAVVGEIITEVYERGYKVTRMKRVRMTSEDLNHLLAEEMAEASFAFTSEYLTGAYVYGLELTGLDVVAGWRAAVGQEDPARAAPGTLRARRATDPVHNCVYVSPTHEVARRNLEYFFPVGPLAAVRLPLTPTLSNCSLCLVKPHAVAEGKLGRVLQALDAGGFHVTALNMYRLDTVNAAEFLEVYKGIVGEYKAMVEEVASGPCVAMEVVAKDPQLNTAVELRKLVGPADPEIGRLLRPHTLRAQLGRSKVHNALHCSDLPEDGLLEVEYFFKILSL